MRAAPLARPPTLAEAALLNPDLSRLDENLSADVMRAELGFEVAEPLLEYALAGTPEPVS